MGQPQGERLLPPTKVPRRIRFSPTSRRPQPQHPKANRQRKCTNSRDNPFPLQTLRIMVNLKMTFRDDEVIQTTPMPRVYR